MKVRLTDRNIKRKPPATGQIELWDRHLPGFGLRISHGGKRTYNVMVRVDGKQRRLTVGNAELLGLAEARDKAREIMRDAQRGIDPVERERIEHRERQLARRDTFASVAEAWLVERVNGRLKSAKEIQRQLSKEIFPALGHLSIGDITRTDVKLLLTEKARSAPVLANRLLSVIRPVFLFAVEEGLLDRIPIFTGLLQVEKPRDRVLRVSEIADVSAGCEKIGGVYADLIRFALLTGQRRSECAGLTWAELDGDGWRLPADRSKNGQGHLIPLATAAMDIINAQPRNGEFVFMSNGTPVGGWSAGKRKLDKAITAARGEPLPHWTVHDLRRTCATGMQSLGVSDEIVDRVLNHVQTGVRKSYNHYAHDEAKRQALSAWSQHVEAVVTGEPAASNVVELAKV